MDCVIVSKPPVFVAQHRCDEHECKDDHKRTTCQDENYVPYSTSDRLIHSHFGEVSVAAGQGCMNANLEIVTYPYSATEIATVYFAVFPALDQPQKLRTSVVVKQLAMKASKSPTWRLGGESCDFQLAAGSVKINMTNNVKA
eukprot:scaffold204098_cov31-Prasinocladus_malaysianus.AAC.3